MIIFDIMLYSCCVCVLWYCLLLLLCLNKYCILRTCHRSESQQMQEAKKNRYKSLQSLKSNTLFINVTNTRLCLHSQNPLSKRIYGYLFHSHKMSGFNRFDVIHISKKYKKINNNRNCLFLFVVEFDKTLILSQFGIFFNI